MMGSKLMDGVYAVALPQAAAQLIGVLNAAGHAAYAVGGCVRDSLLGRTPKDWDICTDALPEQVMAAFQAYRVLPTGLKHGTVTVFAEGEGYEITTFRKEAGYSDHRHPDAVAFVSALREDLARRDFTMNAMAYHPQEGLKDYFGGVADLRCGTIRCVGQPAWRFEEDALRMMRALRFAAVYGFTIEAETARAIHACRRLLSCVAPERLRAELDALLCGAAVEKVLLAFPDVIFTLIPELAMAQGFNQHNRYHAYDVWTHTVKSVAAAPQDITLRLTMLLHDVGKPLCFTRDASGVGHFYGHPAAGAQLARGIFARLRYDRATAMQVERLVEQHCRELPPRDKPMRRALNRLGEVGVRQLLAVKRADIKAQAPAVTEERLLTLCQVERCLDEVLAQGACFTLKDLAVSGKDLLELGMQPGPDVGKTLKALLEDVLDGRLENEYEALLETVKKATE